MEDNFFDLGDLLGTVLPDDYAPESMEEELPRLAPEEKEFNTVFDYGEDLAAAVETFNAPDPIGASAIVRNSILAADASKDTTSYFQFIHYFHSSYAKKNSNQMSVRIETALMATNAFTKMQNDKILGPKDAANRIESALFKRAFSSLSFYGKQYNHIRDYIENQTNPVLKDIMSMIFKYEILPVSPLKDSLRTKEIKVYSSSCDMPTFDSIQITEQKYMGEKFSCVISEDLAKDPLIYIKKYSNSRYDILCKNGVNRVKLTRARKWSMKTKKEFLTYRSKATNEESAIEETNHISDDEVIHLIRMDEDDTSLLTLLGENKVFFMYYPVKIGSYVAAIPETQLHTSICGYLYSELKSIESRHPATVQNILDYVYAHKMQEGYEVTNWELGRNLNGTKYCEHYLETLGILPIDYYSCFSFENDVEYVNIQNLRNLMEKKMDFSTTKSYTLTKQRKINAKTNLGELIPSRINWRGDQSALKNFSYGYGECTRNTCACLYINMRMLASVGMRMEPNRLTISKDKNTSLSQRFPIPLNGDGTVQRYFIQTRLNKKCNSCGHFLNSLQCKAKCSTIMKEKIKRGEVHLSTFVKMLEDIQKKEHDVLNRNNDRKDTRCLHCPIYINFDNLGDYYSYTETSLNEEFFGDQLLIDIDNFRKYKSDYYHIYEALMSLANTRIFIQEDRFDEFTRAIYDYKREKNLVDNLRQMGNRKHPGQGKYFDDVRKTMNIIFEKKDDNKIIPYKDLAGLRMAKEKNPINPCYMCETHQKMISVLKYRTTTQRSGDPGYDQSIHWNNPANPPVSLKSPVQLDDFDNLFGSGLRSLTERDNLDFEKIYGPSLGREIDAVAKNLRFINTMEEDEEQ